MHGRPFRYVLLPMISSSLYTVHRGGKWPFFVQSGFGKPLLRTQGGHRKEKRSPEKVSCNWHLQIDTFLSQKLELNYLELSCSRLDRQKLVFWQMQYFAGKIEVHKNFPSIFHFNLKGFVNSFWTLRLHNFSERLNLPPK